MGADGHGNTVGLFSAVDGDLKGRLWYTPSGEVDVAVGVNGVASLDALLSTTDFRYLYRQGRFVGGMVLEDGQLHGGITLRADGQQHDALLNGVVHIDNTAFWDDVNDIEYPNITWWDRYGTTTLRAGVVVSASIAGDVIGGVVTFGNPLGVVAGGYIAGSLAASAFVAGDRYESGQSPGESLVGGLLDGTGVASSIAGRTNRDIVTGEHLGLSQRQMEVQRFMGYLALLPVAGVTARGAGSAARATGLARPVNVVRPSANAWSNTYPTATGKQQRSSRRWTTAASAAARRSTARSTATCSPRSCGGCWCRRSGPRCRRDGQPVEPRVVAVREAIEDAGASLRFLPPYSPDLNPIELAFSKLRRLFESAGHRTVDALWRDTQRLLDLIRPRDAEGFFRHCGYNNATGL